MTKKPLSNNEDSKQKVDLDTSAKETPAKATEFIITQGGVNEVVRAIEELFPDKKYTKQLLYSVINANLTPH